MSRKGLNIGAADEAIFSTFPLGVVQTIMIVRSILGCLACPNSRCGRPVEGNQAFAAEHHVGMGVAQSFDLHLGLPINIDGVDIPKPVLWFVSHSVVNCGCERTYMRTTLQDNEWGGFVVAPVVMVTVFVPDQNGRLGRERSVGGLDKGGGRQRGTRGGNCNAGRRDDRGRRCGRRKT